MSLPFYFYNDIMEDELNLFIEQKFPNVIKVRDILYHYFDEENVDVQILSPTINRELSIDTIKEMLNRATVFYTYIHFPHLTVTNEFNKSIEIGDIWIKFPITPSGELYNVFTMGRSTYPLNHITSDYMFSHTPGVSTTFLNVCLGTGPLTHTVNSLSAQFDEDLWQLFCVELGLYIKTESVAGVPYRKLENVTPFQSIKGDQYYFKEDIFCTEDDYNTTLLHYSSSNTRALIGDFIDYLYNLGSSSFKFSFSGIHDVAYSNLELRVKLSNLFIEWFNKENNPYNKSLTLDKLIELEILCRGRINNNRIDTLERTHNPYGRFRSLDELLAVFNNKVLCYFKGEPVVIKVLVPEIPQEEEIPSQFANCSLFLTRKCSNAIHNQIRRALNYVLPSPVKTIVF